MATGLEKASFHSNPKERQCQRCSNYHAIVLISHDSKVMLKILQARLQKYVNQELLDVQTAFRKRKRTRDKIANIYWIIEKLENSRKTSTSASLTMLKPLNVWITTNCGKFLQTTLQNSMEIPWKTRKGVRQSCLLSPCLFNLYAEYIMQLPG